MLASGSRNHWRLTGLMACAILLGLVIRDGADREPADPCRPLTAMPPFPGTLLPAASTFTIASYNIHGGKGTDGTSSLERIAGLLDGSDIATLFEVRNPGFSTDDNQAADLASRLKMGAAFVPTERHWWREHFGNAVLSRGSLGPLHRLPLPGTRGKAFRTAILTTFPWDTASIQVLAVHIDREQDRKPQLTQVIDLFLNLTPPVILAGDLNTEASDPILKTLLEREGVHSAVHDKSPLGYPEGTIDWILQRGLETVSAELVSSTASDHPLVKAEFRLPHSNRNTEIR